MALRENGFQEVTSVRATRALGECVEVTSEDRPGDPEEGVRVLDEPAFLARLESEVALVRRKGRMLSVLLLGRACWRSEPPTRIELRAVADSAREQLRLHDVIGILESNVAVLLPATTAIEASCAAVRLLQQSASTAEEPLSVGLASGFGEVPGGAGVLLAAAQEALESAPVGQIVTSSVMHGRPSVLLVDDDLPHVAQAAEMLSQRGWESCPSSLEDDALRQAQDPRHAAVFVNLAFARGSGNRILRAALASHPERPVVLMSDCELEPVMLLQVLESGPVLFVKKPLSSTDLDAVVAVLRDCLPAARTGRRPPKGD
ncbi:MAG TPA: response regulator [Vicinamibacteria bacterium]|nr:response regulator [Vicinamibacteria bacterium]